jgi:hypothetical protein
LGLARFEPFLSLVILDATAATAMSSPQSYERSASPFDIVVELMEELVKESRRLSSSYGGMQCDVEDCPGPSISIENCPSRGEKVYIIAQRKASDGLEYLVGESVHECTYKEYQSFQRMGYKAKGAPRWSGPKGAKVALVYWEESWISAQYLNLEQP